ncbi:MAG: four helix bundle protein [Oceanospirillaceae bacterium]|nr:four helix bundle protein [Oceanospirillaceae bacterium]MCP5334797.1 four helix bundle protein [Oceanospirillaceae bacterium]MCP5350489.1 four helix bundle protein [Oceanospirillaceae bacterium]
MAVWQLAMQLVEQVYQLTALLPEHERFGLISQMRRCAVSVPSNIAEGAARRSDKDFLRFLGIARGSLMELDTQLEICFRLGFLQNNHEAIELIEHVFAKLNALMSSVKQAGNEG